MLSCIESLNLHGFHNYEYCCNYINYNQHKQLYMPLVKRLESNTNNSNNQKQKQQQQKQQPPSRKAIEEANLKKGLETKIEQGNKGYDILLKMGYQEGQGLGKDGAGIMEPLGIVKKSDRKGLGTVVSAKTTEENENSQKPKKLSRSQRKRNAKKQPKDVIFAQQEAQKAKDQADKASRAADKALEAADRAKQLADNIMARSKDIMEIDDEFKLRRPHSPIRAPTPTPPPPPPPQQLLTPSKISTPKVTQKQNSVKPQIAATKTPNKGFSINEPGTPRFLQSVSRCFRSDIELMQLRLEAAASLNSIHADDELIVAKIVIGHNQTVAEHAFEFIRTDLVGWIGAYQEDGMDTPIFHSMTNNESHITVVCDNAYAYECLDKCITDISLMATMGSVRVIRLPPITPLIYCFDAVYEGIARDTNLFRRQIHLHKSKLYSDNWIVVSHEVRPEERKTFFIFLIDERSALALNFHYSSNLFICMQKVSFHNRGIVTEGYFD